MKDIKLKNYSLEIRNLKKGQRLTTVITSPMYRKFYYSGDIYFDGKKIQSFSTTSTSVESLKESIKKDIKFQIKL